MYILVYDQKLEAKKYTGCGISQLTEYALQCIVALMVFTKQFLLLKLFKVTSIVI
jgi:hypothetical protein